MIKTSSGFTLLELIVTLAIGAITVSIGVPSFASFTQNNRISAQSNEFIASLNLTRSEAIKRSMPVKICRSADGASCGDDTINWHDGWMIFTDNDGTVNVRDGTDTLIRVHGPLNTPNTTLDWNGTTAASVVFDANGATTDLGSFLLCDKRGKESGRAIVVAINGRVRSISAVDGSASGSVQGAGDNCIF